LKARNNPHAIRAVAGKVIIQDNAIFFIIDFSTYVLSFPFIFLRNSLRKPTPNIPQIAICVELTGKPN
jgi:hypothetical protein